VTFLYVALAAVLVFVIAAVVVGREAHRLDAVAPRSVYIPQEALEFVAEYLPPESQARLTPDELEQLLLAHMRWLHAKGLQPTNVIDRRQDILGLVVIADDTVNVDGDITLTFPSNGFDAHLAYFAAIGAVGPPAPLAELSAPSEPPSAADG